MQRISAYLAQWGWRSQDWWKGDRGEYWFFAQVIVLLSFVLVPVQTIWPLSALEPLLRSGLFGVAGLLALVALYFLGKGLLDLGQSLTPLPYPREDGQLVQTGAYGRVRHPLYAGLILGAIAWVLVTLSWPHTLLTVALTLLLNAKASQEEQWLLAKYPDYATYRQQVKKLLPGIY